jgi:hypothetical protein
MCPEWTLVIRRRLRDYSALRAFALRVALRAIIAAARRCRTLLVYVGGSNR